VSKTLRELYLGANADEAPLPKKKAPRKKAVKVEPEEVATEEDREASLQHFDEVFGSEG
jgi:hypothetical protein